MSFSNGGSCSGKTKRQEERQRHRRFGRFALIGRLALLSVRTLSRPLLCIANRGDVGRLSGCCCSRYTLSAYHDFFMRHVYCLCKGSERQLRCFTAAPTIQEDTACPDKEDTGYTVAAEERKGGGEEADKSLLSLVAAVCHESRACFSVLFLLLFQLLLPSSWPASDSLT